MIKKTFFTFFAVQLVTYITTVIGNMIDGIVTGSYLGTEALSAYGLATPFLTVITAIATALSVGTSTLVSNNLGKGKTEEMKKSFQVCFWVIVVASILIAVAIYVFASPLATMLKAQGSIHELTVDYLRGYGIGIPAIYTVVLAMPIMQIIGRRAMLIIAIVTLSSVNIVGDFVNVLFLQGGMFGMGLATSISFYVASVIIIVVIASKKSMLSIAPRRFEADIIKEMVIYGTPNAVSMGCRNVLGMVLNSLIISIAGIHMVAAYAAISSVMNMAMAIGSGMASAVSVLTGIFSGEKDREDLITLVKLSVRYSIIINSICTVVFIVFSRSAVSLFLKENDLLADASLGLQLVVLNLVFFSINFCIRSYYQAMKIKISITYAVFSGLVSTAVIAVILGYTIGITGVWIAYPLGEMLTLIAFWIYAVCRNKSSKCHGIIERIMLLPDDYYSGVEPLEITACSMDEVLKASKKAKQYLLENNASNNTAVFSELAIEELGGNIIRYGFADNKSHHIMIKLKSDGDKWIVRLRDDCQGFDPVKYVEGITKEERENHFGIRMVYELSDDVVYLNTMSLNNILIYLNQEKEGVVQS